MAMEFVRHTPPSARFVAFTVVLFAAHAVVLRALTEFAARNETASHVIGVPLVSIALLYANRQSIAASARTTPLAGTAIIALGAALSLVSSALLEDAQHRLSLQIAGLALSWIGGFVFFYGWTAARLSVFPLAFLAFMVPPPGTLVDAATQFLKVGSTEAVASLFSLTGTPYHRQGFVFALPTFVIEIADECSGIRSSIALLLTSLLAGYTFLNGPLTKTVLLLAILPVALLKNGIRIVSLSLLAMHVDPSFLTGQLHHEGGIVFFMLSLVLLAPVLALLRWYETRADRNAA